MKNSLNEIYKNDKHRKKIEQTYENNSVKSSEFKSRANDNSSTVVKSNSKTRSFQTTIYHEHCCTLQAVLLACSVLVLSFNGARHGRYEYSLLENGQTVYGGTSKSSKRAVVTLSLGYSAPYSILSSIAAVMLLYSIFSKKASWSLPSMVLSMSDLVCDVGDAVVAIWLFFANLRLTTAILYSVGTVVIILGEFWIWIGVLQLYEDRAF